MSGTARIAKSYPVFDCDAHIDEPAEIWDYIPESERELVQATYWWGSDGFGMLNGTTRVPTGGNEVWAPSYNPVSIAGPQMNKKIMRKLLLSELTEEQRDYVTHKGAVDPHARVRDMDLMGIDQVLVIPTYVVINLPFARSAPGSHSFARGYNNWLRDWCNQVPGRLFGAAVLPPDPRYAAAEVHRAADLGFPVGLIRPIEGVTGYPNDIGSVMMARDERLPPTFDLVFRAFEDTGMCLGMHTQAAGAMTPMPLPGQLVSPGDLLARARTSTEALSFVFEAQTWLAQVLLSGFLDRYPRLRMLIFESNSQWLPYLLETCDRLFRLFKNERDVPATRLPSEAFYEQCAISFESDEAPTFKQWSAFEDIGIWASDAYHHDGADAWSAIRSMRELGVPDGVEANLMGANARRLYGIEGELFVTDEPGPIERPEWFPQGPEFDHWCEQVSDPRANEGDGRHTDVFPSVSSGVPTR